MVCYIGKNWLVLVDLFCLLQNKKVVGCPSLPFDTSVKRLSFPFSHSTFQREVSLLGQLLKIYNTFLLYSHPLFFFFFSWIILVCNQRKFDIANQVFFCYLSHVILFSVLVPLHVCTSQRQIIFPLSQSYKVL